MEITLLLEMAADGFGDRVAIGSRAGGISYASLLDRSRRAGEWVHDLGVDHLAMLDQNSEALPIALFAAAVARVPFVPLNYRLTDAQLGSILPRVMPAVVVVEEAMVDRLAPVEGQRVVTRGELLDASRTSEPPVDLPEEADDVAVLLFTSGTTGEPKAAILRHRHLSSYVMSTLEFMGADDDECALVSVPPYHVAGISAVLSSVYVGRRMVHLAQFDPASWVTLARDEAVTHAMVVPTMLGRILDVLERDREHLPALRNLSYGGGRMPLPVIQRALALLPDVDFVNAYGLTETSSTIAVLSPDDHRAAVVSDDPAVRARLGSVGRPSPAVEVSIRDEEDQPLPAGRTGEVWVRGEQVSGEYVGRRAVDAEGWFATRDAGHLDAAGYLFVEGRLDDVIVRGGENISPGEIEEVLVDHPAVAEVAVVGVPDEQWGERVAAAVVLEPGATATEAELQQWVRDRLRSTRMPAHVDFYDELPYNETGKLLRRVLREDLTRGH